MSGNDRQHNENEISRRELLQLGGLTLGGLSLLELLSGCHQTVRPAGSQAVSPAASVARVPTANRMDAPGLTMPQRLQLINASLDPQEVPYLNVQRAARLQTLVAAEQTSYMRAVLLPQYADELVKAGKTEEAVRQYQDLLALDAKHHVFASPGDKEAQLMALAIAYLRMGEQQNCLLNHTSDSCLLPIQGGGIHKIQQGSRGAIKALTEILKANGNSFAARWLLNIAYMTLGEYPLAVPKQWLVPPDVFKSDYDIKRFPDIAGNLGLDLQQLAGGVIIEDFDNDGYLDIMISGFGPGVQLRYFHNNADGTFTERTQEAGLTGETGGLNMIQADYNNDGWVDVLILRGAWFAGQGHWPMSLLRNNGDGTFTDVTEQAGLLRFHPTQTAVWFDYNGDGWLDLYVGNESSSQDKNPCELFRNNGDGTFTECAKEYGVDYVGYVKGVVSADFNNDGRPDLYLSELGKPHVLFRNDGPAGADKSAKAAWKFTNVAAQAGVEKPLRSFSCFFFDYDNDGWPDLFTVGYNLTDVDVGEIARDYMQLPTQATYPCLYHNNRDGTFTDVTKQARLHKLMFGMGINFGDLDNDGWLDFYVGTGLPSLAFLIPNRMFRNAGGKYFQEVTTSGDFGHLQKGHAIAFADLNNNGSQDVFAVMGGLYESDTAFDTLYENPGHGNHWITLKLEGVQTNRSAIGARIKVVILEGGQQRAIYKTVGSGGSFGANPLRQEIGLGQASAIDHVEIFWPVTGKTQLLTGLELDRFYKVREGDAQAVLWPLKTFAYAHGNGMAHHHHHMAS
jgi:hypothetical protein